MFVPPGIGSLSPVPTTATRLMNFFRRPTPFPESAVHALCSRSADISETIYREAAEPFFLGFSIGSLVVDARLTDLVAIRAALTQDRLPEQQHYRIGKFGEVESQGVPHNTVDGRTARCAQLTDEWRVPRDPPADQP